MQFYRYIDYCIMQKADKFGIFAIRKKFWIDKIRLYYLFYENVKFLQKMLANCRRM